MVAAALDPAQQGTRRLPMLRNLYLIVVMTVLVHLAFAGARVTLSLFAIHQGASPLTVGALISLLAILPMLFSVHAGRVVDRIGIRRPLITAAAMVVAGLLIACALPKLGMLFLVSALVGSGFMLFHIGVSHAAGVIGQPEHRARNFSLLALGFSISGFLGPLIAGFAIDGIGHRLTFLALSMSAIIALALVIFSGIDTPRVEAGARYGEHRRLMDLIRIPEMRRVLIVSSMLSMAWDLFGFVTPIYGSRIGLSASAIGMILGAFGAGIFVVRVMLPLFALHVREWAMLLGAMFASGFTLAIFPLVDSAPVLAFLALLLGIGLGGSQPMIMALLYNSAPHGRGGEAVGIRTLLLNFSQSSIPLLFGALGTALGMAPVFWSMAIALLAGGYYARRPR